MKIYWNLNAMSAQAIKSRNNWLLGLLLACASYSTYALDTDVEQPVEVEADSATFDRNAGTATYDGKVIIKQGTLEILADHVDILAPDNEIQHVTATGKPVDFKQDMENGKVAQGKALEMQYFVKEKRLTLTGEAELHQDQDIMTGHFMEYLADKGQLKAEGKGSKTGRISAILYPSSSANSKPAKGKDSKNDKKSGDANQTAATSTATDKDTTLQSDMTSEAAASVTTTVTGKETLKVFTIPKSEPSNNNKVAQ